jgi:hypothetical protein
MSSLLFVCYIPMLSVSRLYTSIIEWLMNMEQLVEWELTGETEVLGEILPQFHFVHHKSHMSWPEIERVQSYGVLCYDKAVSSVVLRYVMFYSWSTFHFLTNSYRNCQNSKLNASWSSTVSTSSLWFFWDSRWERLKKWYQDAVPSSPQNYVAFIIFFC